MDGTHDALTAAIAAVGAALIRGEVRADERGRELAYAALGLAENAVALALRAPSPALEATVADALHAYRLAVADSGADPAALLARRRA
jgi:hypothetical protein